MQKVCTIILAGMASLLIPACGQEEPGGAEPKPALKMVAEEGFEPASQSIWDGATTIELAGTHPMFPERVELEPIPGASISSVVAGQRLTPVDYGCSDCAFVEEFGANGEWAGFKRGRGPMNAKGEWRVSGDQICVLIRSPDDARALSICRQLLRDQDGRFYLPDFRFYAFRRWEDLHSARSLAERVMLFRVSLNILA